MKLLVLLPLVVACAISPSVSAAGGSEEDDKYAPHTPTLIYYVTGLSERKAAESISSAVGFLPGVRKVFANIERSYVQVRFDSHVVSYHQVAQAILDGGRTLGLALDPRLKVRVPEYSQPGNAAKVDAIFAGKRLNQRVKLEPANKEVGEFILHFLPLELDSKATGPQGFNGGHLNHPIHDPPPRGLGLTCIYASEDR
jgi:copper chaperone CopZ